MLAKIKLVLRPTRNALFMTEDATSICGSETPMDAAVEVIKKCEKFLVAMARLAQGDHFAIEGVECREQGGSAVAVVIVTYSFDIAQSHRQREYRKFRILSHTITPDGRE